MPAPSNETLRDLLSLIRTCGDESADQRSPPRQDVGGPYRSERETLEHQVQEELERLDEQRALLEERRALLRAVRAANRPPRRGLRLLGAVLFGAFVGSTTAAATLALMVAPYLRLEPILVRPPSEWREPPGATLATAPHRFTSLTPTLWQVNEAALDDDFHESSVRAVRCGSRLGWCLYGVRPHTIADQMGLRNGDALIAVNGQLIDDLRRGTRESDAWRAVLVAIRNDGRSADLSFVRRGEPMTFTYFRR